MLYAWNSTPIPDTNLSHCFVALGHKFQLSFNFSAKKHLQLTYTPSTVTSYFRNLASHLSALCNVAHILVNKQRAYHCKFVNSHCSSPSLYSEGDIVFARRAVCSNAARGQVDKLTYPYTGPQLLQNSMVPHMKSNTVQRKPKKRRMLLTSPSILILLSLFLSVHSTAPTTNTVIFIRN